MRGGEEQRIAGGWPGVVGAIRVSSFDSLTSRCGDKRVAPFLINTIRQIFMPIKTGYRFVGKEIKPLLTIRLQRCNFNSGNVTCNLCPVAIPDNV